MLTKANWISLASKTVEDSYTVEEHQLPSEAEVVTYDDLIARQDAAIAELLEERDA